MIIQPIIDPLIVGILTVVLLIGTIYFSVKSKRTATGRTGRWINRTAIVLLLAALALRPGIGTLEEAKIYSNQFDIYFMVDKSGSMNAEDWDNTEMTRLDAVKEDISDLVDHYAGARFSLITFDNQGTIKVPLTTDASTFMSGVDILKTELTKYSKGSSIDAGLELLEGTLRADTVRGPDKQRIVFFFSDGEQTVEKEPASFSPIKPLIDGGMVYGYGTTTGGKMKQNNGYIITTTQPEYIMDPTTNTVAISILDEENLRMIANDLGVDYQHRTPDNSIEFIELEATKEIEAGTRTLKVTADFSWLISSLLIILISVELIYVLITARKTFRNMRSKT